jgi:hypothetical protein
MLDEKMRPDAMVLRTVSCAPCAWDRTISSGTPMTAHTSRWNLDMRNSRSSHGVSMGCCATSWSRGSVKTSGWCVDPAAPWSNCFLICADTKRSKMERSQP